MDLTLVGPLCHLWARLPERALVRLMPLYDAYCRALYRTYLRFVVRDKQTRAELLPRYGILAKRPVISSAFLPIAHQSSQFRIEGAPVDNIAPGDKDRRVQEAKLAWLRRQNRAFTERSGDERAIEAAIGNLENYNKSHTGGASTFKVIGSSGAAGECAVVYTQPVSSGAAPVITSDENNC